jgi:tRNA pseudouridine38-40 synthase
MTRYRAALAYDGTAYQGFQRQAGSTPTIQLALEQALERVTGQAVTVNGAGRTDSGVHATGQVIAFDVDWRHSDADLLRALNAVLPGDIALQDIAPQPGFHPRFDAVARLYTYDVLNAPQRQPLLRFRAWHVWAALDVDVMAAAAALLLGEHDFATFGQPPQGTNTVRAVLRSEWAAQPVSGGTRLTYTIEANAFLQHMVRRVVGMLVEVGRGALTLAQFEAAFRAADLAQAGPLAPPQGLVLAAVRYR